MYTGIRCALMNVPLQYVDSVNPVGAIDLDFSTQWSGLKVWEGNCGDILQIVHSQASSQCYSISIRSKAWWHHYSGCTETNTSQSRKTYKKIQTLFSNNYSRASFLQSISRFNKSKTLGVKYLFMKLMFIGNCNFHLPIQNTGPL